MVSSPSESPRHTSTPPSSPQPSTEYSMIDDSKTPGKKYFVIKAPSSQHSVRISSYENSCFQVAIRAPGQSGTTVYKSVYVNLASLVKRLHLGFFDTIQVIYYSWKKDMESLLTITDNAFNRIILKQGTEGRPPFTSPLPRTAQSEKDFNFTELSGEVISNKSSTTTTPAPTPAPTVVNDHVEEEEVPSRYDALPPLDESRPISYSLDSNDALPTTYTRLLQTETPAATVPQPSATPPPSAEIVKQLPPPPLPATPTPPPQPPSTTTEAAAIAEQPKKEEKPETSKQDVIKTEPELKPEVPLTIKTPSIAPLKTNAASETVIKKQKKAAPSIRLPGTIQEGFLNSVKRDSPEDVANWILDSIKSNSRNAFPNVVIERNKKKYESIKAIEEEVKAKKAMAEELIKEINIQIENYFSNKTLSQPVQSKIQQVKDSLTKLAEMPTLVGTMLQIVNLAIGVKKK